MAADDPFDGLLERSSVAQALREARASLARPSRPYTPASRSLFQQGTEDTYSQPRPSSSYSIDSLRFVRDTFASSSCGSVAGSTRSSGSTRTSSSRSGSRAGSRSSGSRSGSRSGLRSRESLAACASTAELYAVPELEETEPELEQLPVSPPDIVEFGASGEVISGSGGAASALEFEVEDPDFEAEEEYDVSSTADDLALCMDVPPPGSDEESADEDGRHTLAKQGRSAANPAIGTRKSGAKPQRKVGREARSAGEKAAGGAETVPAAGPAASPEVAAESAALLRQAVEQLEALDTDAPSDTHAEKLMAVTASTRAVAAQLREGKCVDHEAQAPKLLRAVLVLMDGKAGPACLLRLARCTVELLQVGSVVQDVGTRGVEAAYLNIARALFKLSKDAGNDAVFREEGLLESLLLMLGGAVAEAHQSEIGASSELRIFVVGVLKNISNDDENQKQIIKRGALPALLTLLRPASGPTGSAHEAQLFIQVTALLRNLAGSSKRQRQLVELGALDTLMVVSSAFMSHMELQVNIARIFAKLSNSDAAWQALESDASPLQQVARCLREYAAQPAVVLRLTFALGNITASCDRLRQIVMFDCDVAGLLPALLERYWKQDQALAQATSGLAAAAPGDAPALPDGAGDAAAAPQETVAQECESVLVKLVRLAANVTINPAVGTLVASEPSVVDPLLGMLACKRIQDSEELVLSATAALTNLLYYDCATNLLFTAQNKESLCRLLRPMILESYNVEVLVEAARALGNLSRHTDARQWIGELRIDEALSILLAHGDRDLVFYACGALVNLASDQQTGVRLCREGGLREKLAALLRDTPVEDAELLLVGVKVLSNLRLEGDGEEPWPQGVLADVRAGITRAHDAAAAAAAAAGDAGDAGVEESLVELAGRLLDSLPLTEEEEAQLKQQVNFAAEN